MAVEKRRETNKLKWEKNAVFTETKGLLQDLNSVLDIFKQLFYCLIIGKAETIFRAPLENQIARVRTALESQQGSPESFLAIREQRPKTSAVVLGNLFQQVNR